MKTLKDLLILRPRVWGEFDTMNWHSFAFYGRPFHHPQPGYEYLIQYGPVTVTVGVEQVT